MISINMYFTLLQFLQAVLSPVDVVSHTAAQILAAYGAVDVEGGHWPQLLPALLDNISNHEVAMKAKISSLEVRLCTYVHSCSTQNSISSMRVINTSTSSTFPLYLFFHWYKCMLLQRLAAFWPVMSRMYCCYLTISMINLWWDEMEWNRMDWNGMYWCDGMGYILTMRIATVWYGTY